MKRAAAILLAALALASCGTSTSTGAEAVINRPDGMLIVWSKSWYKNRFRMPMDHGAAQTLQAQVFQAFTYPTYGGAPGAIPVSFVAKLTNGVQSGFSPAVSWRDGAPDMRKCFEPEQVMGGVGYPCSDRETNFLGQTARRAEDARTDGLVLVLAVGPGGERNCRIDLASVFPSASLRKEQSGYRLAHFPGRGSYLAKVEGDKLPVYRLQCGQSPELLGDFAVHETGGWTAISDVAPGPDPSQPRVLLRTQARHNVAIVATPDGEIFASPADAIQSQEFAFLTFDAREIIVGADFLWSDVPPRLTLELVNVETGERRTLDFRHEFAPWPKRP